MSDMDSKPMTDISNPVIERVELGMRSVGDAQEMSVWRDDLCELVRLARLACSASIDEEGLRILRNMASRRHGVSGSRVR